MQIVKSLSTGDVANCLYALIINLYLGQNIVKVIMVSSVNVNLTNGIDVSVGLREISCQLIFRIVD